MVARSGLTETVASPWASTAGWMVEDEVELEGDSTRMVGLLAAETMTATADEQTRATDRGTASRRIDEGIWETSLRLANVAPPEEVTRMGSGGMGPHCPGKQLMKSV